MTGRRILLCALMLGVMCSLSYAEEKTNVMSGLDVEIYGSIKADASFSDSRVNPGNYVAWVLPEDDTSSSTSDASKDDNEFNTTINESRLGLNITGPSSDKLAVSGKVEFDLYGGTTENSAMLRIRHAYIKFNCLKTGWTLLAGQTYDIVGPLNPSTLNYYVLWYAGNYGHRRPQIRLEKTYDVGEHKLLVQGALARTIGTADPAGLSLATGADAGFPHLQARGALTMGETTIGLSGHWGEEEHDYWGSRLEARVATYSACIDLTMPLREGVKIKGEAHTGSNISPYLGGIGYGVKNAGTAFVDGIRSSGGFLTATIIPEGKWTYNVGYGLEEVNKNDLSSGQRRSNTCAFANAIYNINPNTSIGAEISRWDTNYKAPSNCGGEAWVAQVSFKLTY